MCSKKLMAFALLLSVPSTALYASHLEGETALLSPSRYSSSSRFKLSPCKNNFSPSPIKLTAHCASSWGLKSKPSPFKRMRVIDDPSQLPSPPTKPLVRTPSKFSTKSLPQGSESDHGSLPLPYFDILETPHFHSIDAEDQENDKSALNTPRKEKTHLKSDSSLLDDDFPAFVIKTANLESTHDDGVDHESELNPSTRSEESVETEDEESDFDDSYFLSDDSDSDEDEHPSALIREAELVTPSAYHAGTLAAREGFLRGEYQQLREDGIVMRTPPKPKKKLHVHKKKALKAFGPKYVSPTKTSSYTRSQAKAYLEARQESAKSVADWRHEFLDSINVICKKLRAKKDAGKRPSASSFNTLFLKHFTETAPDFFNQVYVLDTHVFFWNDRMIDLDLRDPDTEETNREKLAKGKNFVLFQSPHDKASIEEDDKGDFKLIDEGNIEPRVSNWLHLTQGKEGKTTYNPSDYHASSPVGQFAQQYRGQNVNIVFAGPEDIHCALHEIMNGFKKAHEPSIHTIPQSYAKERPLANKEILRRLTQ